MGKGGAPGAIRTPDLLIRSQLLYPTELRVHKEGVIETRIKKNATEIQINEFSLGNFF